MNKHAPTPTLDAPVKLSRRSVLKLGLGAGIISYGGIASSENSPIKTLWTPKQTEGPFYPIQDQADKDIDLTQIQGKKESAKGEVIFVRGQVKDTSGMLLNNAFVEIWQANTWGRYAHKRDPNNAPLDPNFQGWGQTRSDSNSRYGFKTIFPGEYPANPDWIRPPHIHFKVSHQGYYPLTTQMYFPNQSLNDTDLILQNLPAEQQSIVISKRQDEKENGIPVFMFDIVLRPI